MEVIYRKLDDLVKLENNPRKISQEQLDKLKESIERNPDYFEARPIILSDRTGELVIIAGNQRYEACRQLGVSEVPTVLMKGLTEEREREIVIRDNVSNGEWDINKLFASTSVPATAEEKAAGSDALNFGPFGLVDYYARRMGITDHEEVESVPWVRVYKCLDMDAKRMLFDRKLKNELMKKTRR